MKLPVRFQASLVPMLYSPGNSGGHACNSPSAKFMLLGSCCLLFCLAGCQPPPATNAHDIVTYLRNGVVGAKVRYLGADAQPYVDKVMTAYRHEEKAMAPIANLAASKALWPLDDNRWRKPKLVAKRLESIDQWLGETNKRETLHQELLEAINGVPPQYASDTAMIRSEATPLLTLPHDFSNPPLEELRQIAIQYQSLLEQVPSEKTEFDLQAKGLACKNAATETELIRLWDELNDTLVQMETRRREKLPQIIEKSRQRREELIDRRTQLRKSESKSSDTLRTIRDLDTGIHYDDHIIDRAERQERALTPVDDAA